MDEGLLPRFSAFSEACGSKAVRMRSVHPCESATAWTSYATGNNPGRHNIYGFTDRDLDGDGRMILNNAMRRTGSTIWSRLSESGKRAVAINVPVNFPPEEVNGTIIGGFLAPGIDGIVHPRSLEKELHRRGYKADPDNSLVRTDLEAWYQDLVHTEEVRVRLGQDLFDEGGWDLFHLHIMGTDRLHHFLWEQHENKEQPWEEKFRSFYRKVDAWLGSFFDRDDGETLWVVLSDHGFCGIKSEVDINALLEREGLLLLGDHPFEFCRNVLPDSLCYSMLPGRIYINLQGREPNGTVPVGDYHDVRERVRDALMDMRTEHGCPLFKEVFRREEIYRDASGEHSDGYLKGKPLGTSYEKAPDLLAWNEEGFDLKAGFSSGATPFRKEHINGMHTWHDALLWVSKGEVIADASIQDVAPAILSILGVEGLGMDGNPSF